MPLTTFTPRAISAVQLEADHWGITGFTVRTPQDGGPTTLVVYSEAWLAERKTVTPLAVTELSGLDAIQGVLGDVADRYAQYLKTDLPAGGALYLAMRDALYALKQGDGVFPLDALTPEAAAAVLAAQPAPAPKI